jgi:hypothetical protein
MGKPWMGAGEAVAGGGGWWSGARKGNRLRERCDYGLACVVRLPIKVSGRKKMGGNRGDRW